ncbi:MAG: DUF1116 domain-containing protein, partial [Pseudomonadota bacterium]
MTDDARFAACRPKLDGVGPLRRFVDLPDRTLLHAGPPYRRPDETPPPVRNAAAVAAQFEGWAADPADALAQIGRREIALLPAQDFSVVTPLAYVAGPTTPATLIACSETDVRAVAPINDGPAPGVIRFGAPDDAALERLTFLATRVAPALDRAASRAPVDLIPIGVAALAVGEDLHALTADASRRFAERIATQVPIHVARYLHAAPHVFLNIWMGVCACFVAAAGDSALSAIGANGVEVGVKLREQQWITRPAPTPAGPFLDVACAERAVSPAIGDSAVIEAAGFGAVAAGRAEDFRATLASFAPAACAVDGASLTALDHPAFKPLGRKRCVDP